MASSFVLKLYEMVENENDDIICWVSNGTAFKVLSPKRLEAEILPKFFRHGRFQSMVRQLNFYAFKKVTKERSSWVYSHEYFLAGRPELLQHLKRKTNGSHECRQATSSVQSAELHDDYEVEDLSDYSPIARDSVIRKRLYSLEGQTDDELIDGETTSTLRHRANSSTTDVFTSNCDGVDCMTPVTGPRKKHRWCESADVEDKDHEANIHEVLSNWSYVHSFFNSKKSQRSYSFSSVESTCFSPSMSGSEDSQDYCGRMESDLDVELSSAFKASDEGVVVSGDNNKTELLQRFCSEKDPWQRADTLCADIMGLLRCSDELVEDMASYEAALAPREHDIPVCGTPRVTVKLSAQQIMLSPDRGKKQTRFFDLRTRGVSARDPLYRVESLCEIAFVRTFLSFLLSSLHNAVTDEENDEKRIALQSCYAMWGDYAQSCF